MRSGATWNHKNMVFSQVTTHLQALGVLDTAVGQKHVPTWHLGKLNQRQKPAQPIQASHWFQHFRKLVIGSMGSSSSSVRLILRHTHATRMFPLGPLGMASRLTASHGRLPVSCSRRFFGCFFSLGNRPKRWVFLLVSLVNQKKSTGGRKKRHQTATIYNSYKYDSELSEQ